jgi:hypothetical protein
MKQPMEAFALWDKKKESRDQRKKVAAVYALRIHPLQPNAFKIKEARTAISIPLEIQLNAAARLHLHATACIS